MSTRPVLRPVIGIISRKVPFFHEGRPYPRYGVAIKYCQAVEAAGGTPVILPMTQEKIVLESLYGLLHGLLLPGGQDVHPEHYGEEPHAELDTVDPLRDLTELFLARRALEDDMPLLGVCRGEQLLNVAAGGTLFQDIHAQVGAHCLRHFQKTDEEWPTHSIRVEDGTRLRDIIGLPKVKVNSYHHQAVKDVAPGFRVNAFAPDGVIEGIESPRHRFVLGVQWHPELLCGNMDFNLALFRRHVEAAGKFASVRSPS